MSSPTAIYQFHFYSYTSCACQLVSFRHVQPTPCQFLSLTSIGSFANSIELAQKSQAVTILHFIVQSVYFYISQLSAALFPLIRERGRGGVAKVYTNSMPARAGGITLALFQRRERRMGFNCRLLCLYTALKLLDKICTLSSCFVGE
jgi:hypothetical protein